MTESACPNNCQSGVVACWSPGGPCDRPNDPGCESCGPCNNCAPARVTLTDDERELLADAFVDANRSEFMDSTVDGEDDAADPDTPILRAVERIVAARLAAVRAQIKADILAYADRRYESGKGPHDNEKGEGMSRGMVRGLDLAARIAGGDQ